MIRRLASFAPLLPAILLGAAIGVGAFTFVYARGTSYLTDDPAACGNCHVMSNHVASWRKASHRGAVCNDCHTPPGVAPKYATKALNGFFHSLAFTTGDFPDEVHITARNKAVTESACLKCHADVVHAIKAGPRVGEDTSCLRCHRDVGHSHQ